MGLLEYHAMPSLRDVAHDGVLYKFSNRSAPDRDKWCSPSRQAAWTVHHKITPCWVTLLQPAQAGSRVVPALLPSASVVETKWMEDNVHHTLYVVFVLSMSRSWFLHRHVRPCGVHTVPNYRLTKSFDFLIENCQKRICINLIAVDLRQKYLYPF